jgi:hypothetical protein
MVEYKAQNGRTVSYLVEIRDNMRSLSILAVCAATLLQTASSTPIHLHHPHQAFPSNDQWPFATVGRPLEQQIPDEDLQDILSQVSQANIEATQIRIEASAQREHGSQLNSKRLQIQAKAG